MALPGPLKHWRWWVRALIYVLQWLLTSYDK
ncbi:unnamed protein product, partial [marine sediment metagenome]